MRKTNGIEKFLSGENRLRQTNTTSAKEKEKKAGQKKSERTTVDSKGAGQEERQYKTMGESVRGELQ